MNNSFVGVESLTKQMSVKSKEVLANWVALCKHDLVSSELRESKLT